MFLTRKRAAATAMIAAAFAVAWHYDRPPEPPACHLLMKFTHQPLPEVPPVWPGHPPRTVRPVHKSLERISSWISSVGAAVALGDLDADGLPNDIVHVDPRTDLVTVSRAPCGKPGYGPFALDPRPCPFDPEGLAPTGVVISDLNEDGHQDIVVVFFGRAPIAFVRKPEVALGPTAFEAMDIADPKAIWNTSAATVADLDGDGHLDLIFANYFADGSRVLDPRAEGSESMQQGFSRASNGGGAKLYRLVSTNPLRYEERPDALPAETAGGWGLAIAAADLDGDLRPEVYIANDFGPDRLLHNRSTAGKPSFALLQGKRTFTTAKSMVLGYDSFKGMGAEFVDLERTGSYDILVSNVAVAFGVMEGHFAWRRNGPLELMKEGVAPYENVAERVNLFRGGWGWDVKAADLDNDGWAEVLQAVGFVRGETNRWPELQEVATDNDEVIMTGSHWHKLQPGCDLNGHVHMPVFMRASDGRYADVAKAIGLEIEQVSRGVATGDADGDGKMDFVVANQWETSWFFHNESRTEDPFVGLSLLLPTQTKAAKTFSRAGRPGADTAGRPAVGARVELKHPDGRVFVDQVDGGNGHSGRRSPDVHFGLGPSVKGDAELDVSVSWRDEKGESHRETVRVRPGWNTVVLGTPERAP